MELLINIILIVLVTFAFIAAIIFLLGKGKEAEDKQESFSYKALREDVQTMINEHVAANVMGLGLSAKTIRNQEKQRLAVSGYVRTCCSDPGSREALKGIIRSYLSGERKVNEKNILVAIPFDNPSQMTARQMGEALIYKFDEGKDIGFSKLYSDYGWGATNIVDGLEDVYEVDEEMVRRTWSEVCPQFSYAERLNILTQMLYSDCFGLGIADIYNQQKGSVEELQIGLCGLPSMNYRYQDEVLALEAEGKTAAEYSKDSFHVVIRGNAVRLSFLSFGTDDELQRVLRNLIKNSNAGELTVANPKIVIESNDGRRISVSRPPASDAWVGFVRKFDTIDKITVRDWCAAMNKGDIAADTVSQLITSGCNIAYTGEMASGKTTFTRGGLMSVKRGLAIRVIEDGSLELNGRKFLHGTNILALRVTPETPETDVLAFVRKTTGQVFVVGEVTGLPMANLTMNLTKISQQTHFSAHYTTTEEMVVDFTNAKLCIGGYTNEKLAEMDAVRTLHFDVHMAKKNGVRYIHRINEVVPKFDLESEFASDSVTADNARVALAEGVREVRKQLGKMKTYEIRPILEYDLEERKLIFHNKPSERCYENARGYMSGTQYKEFVEFFDTLPLRLAGEM